MVQTTDFLPGKTRLLIVEDDSDLRLTLVEYMETRRFSVTSAKSGAEALGTSWIRVSDLKSFLRIW